MHRIETHQSHGFTEKTFRSDLRSDNQKQMKYKHKNETLNNEFDSKKKYSLKIEGFRCNYFPQKQTEFMQRKREKERPEECEA